jgi:hypothetical protein
MSTKTLKKVRAKKYWYTFIYNRGDYFKISRGLEDQYCKQFMGSGGLLYKNSFDVSFECTALEYKKIVAFARRRYGRIQKITRTKIAY